MSVLTFWSLIALAVSPGIYAATRLFHHKPPPAVHL